MGATLPRGMDAVLEFKVGGVGAMGDFAELTNVRDVRVNVEAAVADVTTRDNDGWRAEVPTLRTGRIEFQMVWKPGDAGFEAVKDAFLGGLIIGLRATMGGEGLEADFIISNFSRSEELEGAVLIDVVASIGFSDTAPDWVEPA